MRTDEPTLNSLTKLTGVSMPKGVLTAKEGRKKAVEDSLEWLRKLPKKLTATDF